MLEKLQDEAVFELVARGTEKLEAERIERIQTEREKKNANLAAWEEMRKLHVELLPEAVRPYLTYSTDDIGRYETYLPGDDGGYCDWKLEIPELAPILVVFENLRDGWVVWGYRVGVYRGVWYHHELKFAPETEIEIVLAHAQDQYRNYLKALADMQNEMQSREEELTVPGVDNLEYSPFEDTGVIFSEPFINVVRSIVREELKKA